MIYDHSTTSICQSNIYILKNTFVNAKAKKFYLLFSLQRIHIYASVFHRRMLMRLEGAEIIFLPANFTMPTGKDHWEAILRTRAIENGCYIVAPNQVGQKEQFVAYGNSMIVDPWGTVIARASDKPGVILAEIDLEYLADVRRRNPSPCGLMSTVVLYVRVPSGFTSLILPP